MTLESEDSEILKELKDQIWKTVFKGKCTGCKDLDLPSSANLRIWESKKENLRN